MRKVMLDDQCINDVSLWVKNSWKDISDSIESFRREISFDLNNWKITMLRTTPKFKKAKTISGKKIFSLCRAVY